MSVLLQRSVLEISLFSATFRPPCASYNELDACRAHHVSLSYTRKTQETYLRKSLEIVWSIVHSGGGNHKRLHHILNITIVAIIAKYELIHPIHQLPCGLLTRIFVLVVSEEYAATAFGIASRKEVYPLVSPTCLSLVCYHWRDIAYSAEPLWDWVLVTTHSPPAPFHATDPEKLTFILALEGNRSPHGDEGSLVACHIVSLAPRMSICELNYSGSAFESMRECLVVMSHLK